MNRITSVAFILLVPTLLGGSAASAGVLVSAGSGGFWQWEDRTPGHNSTLSVLGELGDSDNWRLGGEFGFRRAHAEIAGVNDIRYESYRLSFLAQYRFRPDWIIQPYVGLRVTVAVSAISDNQWERRRAGERIAEIGGGIGPGALLGVDIPLGQRIAAYAEVSAGINFVSLEADRGNKSDDDDDDSSIFDSNRNVQAEGIGGLSATTGLRIRF